MPKIKHIAISTQDVEKTARFYIEVFGLKEIGKVNSPNASGYYLAGEDERSIRPWSRHFSTVRGYDGHRSAVDRFLSKIKEAAPSSMVTERFETPPG